MEAGQEPRTADYVLPTISFQSSKIRFRIVTSYWLVFILALPLWWITTSIERLALPVERVKSIAGAAELRFPLDILVEPALGEPVHSNSDLSSLARRVGALIEDDIKQNPVLWKGLDVNVNVDGIRHIEHRGSTYRVELHADSSLLGYQWAMWLTDRSLHIRENSSNHDPVSKTSLLSTLSTLLAPQHSPSQERLVARYANRFRLAFSLLNEDAAAGDAVLKWDLEAAIEYYLSPLLSQLGGLHNFTIESQVQFHAPLAFDPPQSLSTNNELQYILGDEELKMFINSADWTLASSVSEDPVLHFILFVPSAKRRPLNVRTSAGKMTNSFIVPQWGGVVILDPSALRTTSDSLHRSGIYLTTTDMADTFDAFRTQLLALLGVSPFPPLVSVELSSSRGPLSGWQLDALLRKRALENTRDSKEALSSIVKLVDQIENMPVGQDVKGDVQGALDAIEQVYSSAPDSPQLTLQYSALAHTLSSRAFFNPGMLALLYFPAEHTYAVYIPLFAPVSVPLIVAVLREINHWRRERAVGRQKVD